MDFASLGLGLLGVVGAVFVFSFFLDVFENRNTHKQNQYVQGREFAIRWYQDHGVSDSSHDELGNFVDTSKTFGDYSSFDQGIEDVIQETRHGRD